MPYLRKRDTGAVTDFLSPDSVEYQTLKAMRFQSQVTATTPSGSGILAGEVGGTIAAGQPVWEDVAEEDAGFPDPTGGRVLVVALPGAATAQDETVQVEMQSAGLAGNLTDVEYVPNAAIPGVATNNRAITLNEVKVTGAGTPARTVTALASITFDATHSNGGGNVPSPLTITQAAFSASPPDQLDVVSSHNGTGAPDPGGVLYAVYTRA